MELIQVQIKGSDIPSQQYSSVDTSLITNNYINSNFGAKEDYIELFIYDQNGNILLSDYDGFDYYPYLTTNPSTSLYSTLTLDPEKDVINRGFNRGSVNIQYNFLKKLFNSQYGKTYWIKEISQSRTEIKLASQVISDSGILEGFNVYQNYISTKNYYSDFYLNFGTNTLAIGVNVAFNQDDEGAYLIVKLYEPLDADIDVKTQLWIVDKVSEPINYNVNIQVPAEDPNERFKLRGPNYSVATSVKVGQTTPYYSYNTLLTSNVTSSYQKMLNYYQDKSVAINVDYSDFSNFIHFSNASERVLNFKYKVQLIESYNQDIANAKKYSAVSPIIASSSSLAAQTSINNIVSKLDPYETFLYFQSSSYSWPKSNTTQPYTLYSVTSSQVSNFLGTADTVTTATTASLLYSASIYDYSNKDALRYSTPQYILDDSSNQPYLTFLDMIGQHFDNIWLYYKDVSNKFDATNNPNTGISLDLVSDALRGLGMQLYTNTSISDNVYYSLFGINADGSLLPPTGSEMITNYVTSSIATLPGQQIQDEIYKRLYHNLPYLLKTRGTQRGIKALIACYGIPDTILSVDEFGGNVDNTIPGVYDLDSTNYKITIDTGSASVTGSTTISSSLLSPFTTLQYYDPNTKLNSINIEVGFSPSNTINNYISASGVLAGGIDQYIGNPGYAASSSYVALNTLRDSYFQNNYTEKHSVWEYIRLIKFYNNGLFKAIKDFVPARADVSTGIIIKSHMLERNKQPRYEPSVAVYNNYSQSIDILGITGSGGNIISGSTSWSGYKTGSVGYVPFTSSQGVEKFTGEFGGSVITATTLNSFQKQYDISKNFSSSAGSFVTQSLGALFQNVSASVKSRNYLDLDYDSSQVKPSNYGLITQSLSNRTANSYTNYLDPYSQLAQLQDSNYAMQSYTIPRYYGSKTTSATYTTYTDGDDSYGKTAAIDKIKYQYAYLIDIYSSSLQLPGRSNAQIKYIIDNNQNVLNLSKQNNNIFASQNIYKSGETLDISLFDYDPQNSDAQYLTNNSTVKIYEGGFKYSPILYNPAGASTLTYNFLTPTISTQTISTPGGTAYTTPTDANFLVANWTINPAYSYSTIYSQYICNVTASNNMSSPYTTNQPFRFTYTFTPNSVGISNGRQAYTRDVQLNSGTVVGPTSIESRARALFFENPTYFNTPTLTNVLAVTSTPGGTTTYDVFATGSLDKSPVWRFNEDAQERNVIRLSATQSFLYNSPQFIQSGSYPGLESAVFPFVLQSNDMIRLYNYVTKTLDRKDEYRVVNIFTESSGSDNFQYLNVTVDRVISPDNYTVGYNIPNYIVLKHIPDETNLIIEFNSIYNIPTDGILFPQYIDPVVRANSGNVIKALKQQNLI
jgi:hypothetical protein